MVCEECGTLCHDRCATGRDDEASVAEAAEQPTGGNALVGRVIDVYWPLDVAWYRAHVVRYVPTSDQHELVYLEDNVTERIGLSSEEWRLVGERHKFVCSRCLESTIDAERQLEKLCLLDERAINKGVDEMSTPNWARVLLDATLTVTRMLTRTSLVRGSSLLPMLDAAIVRDDSELLSLLLAARCREPFSLEANVMGLLRRAAECDAPVCALLLCNRMLAPEAWLTPATELVPAHTSLRVKVAAGMDVDELQRLATRVMQAPHKRRVAFALALGWRRARAADAKSGSADGGECMTCACNSAKELDGDGGSSAASLEALLETPSSSGGLVRTRQLESGIVETFGDDLSDGVETLPVPWRNSLGDGAVPPPFVYLRHCIAGDSAAVVELVDRPAKRAAAMDIISERPRVRVWVATRGASSSNSAGGALVIIIGLASVDKWSWAHSWDRRPQTTA